MVNQDLFNTVIEYTYPAVLGILPDVSLVLNNC